MLQSPTRDFLARLEFVVKYGWVAFELNRETNYGKYQSKIEAAVQLIQNHIKKLPSGIGSVAALEYVVKNFPLNMSASERKRWKEELKQAIVDTADKSDPDFSSRLFMQSVCWQTGHDVNALEWCDKALEYKSDNANAWFKKGQILKAQGDDLYQQFELKEAEAKYVEAEKSYEKSIQIQSFDHRYWQANGQALERLGELYDPSSYKVICQAAEGRCPLMRNNFEHEAQSKGACSADDEKCRRDEISDRLRSASYFRHAYVYYQRAKFLRPDDIDLEQKTTAARSKYRDILQQINLSESADGKTKADSQKPSQKLSYGELIKEGDDIRCKELSEDKCIDDNSKLLDQAFEYYKKAIWKQPEYPLAWYSRGLAYARRAQCGLGSWVEEEEDYRKAIKDYEKALSLKNDLTWAYYDSGNAYRAIAQLQMQQQSPDSKLAEARPEFESAIENFDRAIRIDPDYEDAWFGRGLTLWELQRYDEAIASYDKAIECARQRRHQSEAGTQNNKKYEDKNQRDLANETSPAVPREAWYWYNRGRAYQDHKDLEEAVASYKKAIAVAEEIGTEYFEPQLMLGIVLRDQGNDYTRSAEALDKASNILKDTIRSVTERTPDSPRLYQLNLDLSGSYQDQGRALREGVQLGEAIRVFKIAHALVTELRSDFPSHAKALNKRLAEIYFEIGDTQERQSPDHLHSEALKSYRDALDCDYCCHHAFEALHQLILRQSPEKVQYYQDAIATFEQLEKQIEGDTDYLYRVKIALLECYLKTKGDSYLEKATRTNFALREKYSDRIKLDTHFQSMQRRLNAWERRSLSGKPLFEKLFLES